MGCALESDEYKLLVKLLELAKTHPEAVIPAIELKIWEINEQEQNYEEETRSNN